MAENVERSSSSTTLTTVGVAVAIPDESSRMSRFRQSYSSLSTSRQIFCLFCIFDLLFTFFLWIIYAQGVSVTGLDDSMSNEIAHYGITSSLFDIALLSLTRVIILLMVYGYYVYNDVYAVAITTSVSTIYLIVKAVVFEFDEMESKGNRPVDYILHIASFILCWAEAWYLLVKVLPREKRVAVLKNTVVPAQNYGAIPPASTAHSMLSFHTPDEDSGEDEVIIRAKLNYIKTARKSTDKAMSFLYAEKQWDNEKNKGDILIESTTDEDLGKVLRVRTFLDVNMQVVYPLIYGDIENILNWNVSLTHTEIIYTVNSTIDITYSAVKEVAGGLISARDFVNLRHFQRIGSLFLSTSTSITSDLKPPVKNFTRGQVPLNCYALSAVDDDPNKSEFAWITTTTMKPSLIPQVVLDRAVPVYLIECVENLKKCCEALRNNGNT